MDINGTTRVCGLIGNPVAHSISPVIHNRLAGLRGDNLVYATFKVEAGNVAAAWKHWNVSKPAEASASSPSSL